MKLKGLFYKKGVNGCGIKLFGFHTPYHKLFENACIIHDLGYDDGGNESRRFFVDKFFFAGMISEANTGFSCFVATVYFLSVRFFGWLFFNYK